MRLLTSIVISGAILLGTPNNLAASDCPNNSEASSRSRTIAVKPSKFPLVGKQKYLETLRLNDGEVVLTFDDGPVAPHTPEILKALAAECVKATFFMMGLNVAEAPHLARQVFDAGHSVGFHSFSHADLSKLPFDKAKKDIELGIEAVTEALGPTRRPAPFFRAPYLHITKEIERFLLSRNIIIWDIDADSSDWTFANPEHVVKNSMAELGKAGKGILLLHDIKAATARALPFLLWEMKRRGFRTVHVVPELSSASGGLAP